MLRVQVDALSAGLEENRVRVRAPNSDPDLHPRESFVTAGSTPSTVRSLHLRRVLVVALACSASRDARACPPRAPRAPDEVVRAVADDILDLIQALSGSLRERSGRLLRAPWTTTMADFVDYARSPAQSWRATGRTPAAEQRERFVDVFRRGPGAHLRTRAARVRTAAVACCRCCRSTCAATAPWCVWRSPAATVASIRCSTRWAGATTAPGACATSSSTA